MSIRSYLFHHSLRHPRLYSIARALKYYFWRLKVRLRFSKGRQYDPDRLVNLDPKYIVAYVGGKVGNRFSLRGSVLGGDWDRDTTPLDQIDVFRSIQMRVVDGLAWEKTPYFDRVSRLVEHGKTIRGASRPDELRAMFHYIDCLAREIREKGFLPTSSLESPESWEPESAFSKHDEVTVSIDRHGHFLLNDGKHRLAIAMCLSIPSIPVAVAARHEDWHRFRMEILDYVSDRKGRSYQAFTHPDLQDVPVQHASKRELMIEKHMPSGSRSLLDIGAYLGFFCLYFSRRGFDCTAVEHHPRHAYFMKKLMLADNVTFKVVQESFLDWVGRKEYDVVLALNIFHHFLKTQALKELLDKRLSETKTKCVFLETHCVEDPIMQGAYANYTPEQFVSYVSNALKLRTVEHLGETSRGRQLFKISV